MNIFEKCKKYEFTKDRFNQFNNHKRINKKNKRKNNKQSTQTNKYFWIIYNFLHSDNSLALFQTNKQQLICDEKFKWISRLEQCDRIQKSFIRKQGYNISDIISDISSSVQISHNSFICLCIIFKIPLIVIKGQFFCTYNETESQTGLIQSLNIDKNPIYNAEVNINEIKNKYIVTKSIQKPLLSLYSYTLSELKHMYYIAYSADDCAPKTKKLIYERLKTKLL